MGLIDLTRYRGLGEWLSDRQLIRDNFDLLQTLLNGNLNAANIMPGTVSPAAHAASHASAGADPVTLAESQITNLVADLAAKAPLASPVFTGNPTAPTPAVDDNDTSLATTAYVQGQKGTANPIVDGTAAPGTSTKWTPIDHVHPTDTSRAPTASPTFTGLLTMQRVAGGTIVPASLGSNQNDYNPTNLANAWMVVQDLSASVAITGLQGGVNGRMLMLNNANATFSITLSHNSASSLAANRFFNPMQKDIIIPPLGTVMLVYYSGNLWLPVGAIGATEAGGIGYRTSEGGTVTQLTSITTGATLSKMTGKITLFSGARASQVTNNFTLTNTFIEATDLILIDQVSGGTLGAYQVTATPAAGSAVIAVRNVHTASLTEAPVLRFAVIKSADA